jgi:hypothetical protein
MCPDCSVALLCLGFDIFPKIGELTGNIDGLAVDEEGSASGMMNVLTGPKSEPNDLQ